MSASVAPARSRSLTRGGPSLLLKAFLPPALLMLALATGAAVGFAVTGDQELRWLALHLALLGGASQLVIGVGQFFACAFLATTPPEKRLVAAQVAAWNVGVVAVAFGVSFDVALLTEAGVLLILGGLALFYAGLAGMRRRSLQSARWALRWYEASAAALAVGAVAGALLARGADWSAGSLLGAHLALNLVGWLGAAIVGTLHTFFPTLTGTRLRFPELQSWTFRLWIVGAWNLALAAAVDLDALAVLAWLSLLASGCLLAANLLASLRTRTIPLSSAARMVATAQLFLPLGLALALILTFLNGAAGPLGPDARTPLAALLIGGWIGLTVAGSLKHLLGVLTHVRRLERGEFHSRNQ